MIFPILVSILFSLLVGHRYRLYIKRNDDLRILDSYVDDRDKRVKEVLREVMSKTTRLNDFNTRRSSSHLVITDLKSQERDRPVGGKTRERTTYQRRKPKSLSTTSRVVFP